MKQIILSTMSEGEISAYLIGDFEKKIIDPSTISNNELLEAEVILILEKNEQKRQETMQTTRFTKKKIIFIVYLENEEQNFSKKSGAEGNSIEYIIAPINQQSINDRIQNLKKNLQNETSSFQNMIQDFFSVLPEIAWYKDTQLKYQYVNQTFVENTEKTAKEIIGKTSEEIWGELYPEIMNRSDHEILADHTSKKFPIFFPGLKHSTFLEINKTPIFRESGELIGIFGFAKNISNFKDLENELQTTLESLPMGASIHDLEGTLICFNDMYRFFCDRPIIIGENVYSSSFDYFNKALDFTREQDQVLIETGNPIVYETE
ncbi:MAG: PAS domain-containing protein, partial [Culicoidibacterales bacterium]